MEEVDKVIYYSDELNDEFSGSNIKPKSIPADYKYIRKNPFYKLFSFIAYRLIATPIAFIYRWTHGIKVVGKKALKKSKGQGYFVYANHTNKMSDVLTPHTINFPTKTYTIVSSENMNIPVLGDNNNMLGALPLPDTIEGSRNFMQAIEKRSVQGHPILIYPEAHIWPYYTGIRPYSSTAFRYPVKFQDASYCFTTTYQKNGNKKKPKIVIYVDGPFYPDKNLDQKMQQENLRDKIYHCMLERSKNSNFEYIRYIKKGE